jgi:nitrate reductase NapAB chaperone NapD
MKKIFSILFIASTILISKSFAQTTAMQLSGPDCNGMNHDLYADLDAGKAVILHFFMPNCGSCPPPAQKIQAMANNILANHPSTITAYAMPYTNSTTCSYTASWCSTNGLSLYMPYDSGATQVAHYGGFGMPTVVLLGGAGSYRVMFSTLSFSTSDTTIMRDSILRLIGAMPNAINELPKAVNSFNVFPNPSANLINIQLELNQVSNVTIDITDITGKIVAVIANEKQSGLIKKQFNTSSLVNGNYIIRLTTHQKTVTQQLSVNH